jgi:hypothetical protein
MHQTDTTCKYKYLIHAHPVSHTTLTIKVGERRNRDNEALRGGVIREYGDEIRKQSGGGIRKWRGNGIRK